MGVVNFIIENILTQASITIALIAMLGLCLQKISGSSSIWDVENLAWFPGFECWFQHYCWQLNLFW